MTDEQKQRMANAEERALAILQLPDLEQNVIYKALWAAGLRIDSAPEIISKELRK